MKIDRNLISRPLAPLSVMTVSLLPIHFVYIDIKLIVLSQANSKKKNSITKKINFSIVLSHAIKKKKFISKIIIIQTKIFQFKFNSKSRFVIKKKTIKKKQFNSNANI